MKRGPRIHFSLRSPYSWIALERLRAAIPGALERAEMIPFWEPDDETTRGLAEVGAELLYVPMSKAKHLYILHDTKRLARRFGLRMKWPIDVEPWWERPHLAWLAARRAGRALPFYDALMEARWGRGDDICREDVVRRAADSAKVDAEIALRAVDEPAIRAEGVDCLARAYRDDVFGVPYFRVGPHRFWGVDRLTDFIEAWPGAPAEELPAEADVPDHARRAVGAYDRDTAGGCG